MVSLICYVISINQTHGGELMNLPTIKNALQNIKITCQNRLEEIYSKGVPDDITERYAKELSFLEQSELIDDFEIFRRLSEETKKSSAIISTCETLSGSILYFLLSNNSFNPLPPHYYCTECGYFELVDTFLFGIDLPQKKCPHCNSDILADGYNLPIESVWGNNGKKIISFDYNANSEFLPFARRVLQSVYPNNAIVPWGIFQFDPNTGLPLPDDGTIGVDLAGYVILPSGTTIHDYPDLISYLENGDTCITGSIWELEEHMLKAIRLFTSEYLDELILLQRATGIYANELGTKKLREITWSNIYNLTILGDNSRLLFHEFKPKTFKDMVAFYSSSHNYFSWKRNDYKHFNLGEYKKMISTDAFRKYPCFTREDFFDYMIKIGVERTLAFDTSERIRRGHANSCSNYKQELFDLPIPNEIKEIAKNYLYAFPRARCIEYILIYAKFAYYAKADGRAFSKIVFRKRS